MSGATRGMDDDLPPLLRDDLTNPGGDDDNELPKKKRRKSDVLILILAVVLLAAALVSGGIALKQNHDINVESGGLKDMSGNPVIPDENDMFSPGFSASADQVNQITPTPDPSSTTSGDNGGGLRFQIPDLGMNVPLGAINAVNGSLNPSNFTNAFWVRNMGVSYDDPSSGTVYVVMHSVRTPGFAPGNFLFSVANQTSSLNPGELIEVGGHTYSFTQSRNVDKPDLANQLDIWSDTPGQLIVITCLQNREHTPSEVNLVIFATLVS